MPPDSAAATLFHRVLIALQARRLRRGAPAAASIAAALGDTAGGRFSEPEREWLGRIEARRAEIPFEMTSGDLGGLQYGFAPDLAEDTPQPAPTAAERLGHAWEVCRWASIPPIWGELLFRLLRARAPERCLELGTGLGLSGAYQAAALELNGRGVLTTVDVNRASEIAGRGYSELGLEHRVRREQGWIDELLPQLLAASPELDYALLDAEHSYAATMRHFHALLPALAGGAVLVLDDILQTDEMRRAWREIAAHPRIALAVPLRRLGILLTRA